METEVGGDFFKMNNGLGQVVIQLEKVRTSPTRLCVRAYQSFANLPIFFGLWSSYQIWQL